VQCQIYKTGSFTEEECHSNCTFVPSVVDVVEGNLKNLIFSKFKSVYFFTADEDKDENLCAFYDEDDCRFAYVYAWDETGKIVVRAQEQRECPPQVYILGE